MYIIYIYICNIYIYICNDTYDVFEGFVMFSKFSCFMQCGPPSYKLVCKLHYHSYVRATNHSEIGGLNQLSYRLGAPHCELIKRGVYTMTWEYGIHLTSAPRGVGTKALEKAIAGGCFAFSLLASFALSSDLDLLVLSNKR